MAPTPASATVLVPLVMRGEDFFRGALIEALGDYDGKYALRRNRRGRQARGPASGRCDHGAREDRRHVAGRAPGVAAEIGAARRAADDFRGPLPDGPQLRRPRGVSEEDARRLDGGRALPGCAARRGARPRRAGRRRTAGRARRAVRRRRARRRSGAGADRARGGDGGAAQPQRSARDARVAEGSRRRTRAPAGCVRHAVGGFRGGALLRRSAKGVLGSRGRARPAARSRRR